MNIIWKENPLRSIVELNEDDIDRMRESMMVDQLHYFIIDLQCRLDEKSKRYSPEEVLKRVKEFDYSKFDKELEEEIQRNIEDLKDLHNIGDCVCFPCTCSKCLAESHLGIDTLQGLGKHAAHNIYSAFFKKDETERTIDEALDYLKNYKVEPFAENEAWKNGQFSEEYYNSWIPKWEADAKAAYDWLLNYKETKLK